MCGVDADGGFVVAAKAGGKQVLAVASEEGMVNFLNAGESTQWDAGTLLRCCSGWRLTCRIAEHGRTSFRAHQNAIFDLSWNKDDSCLVSFLLICLGTRANARQQATASGDQTVKLFDVERQVCVGVLDGHTSTIKNVTWDPVNPSTSPPSPFYDSADV